MNINFQLDSEERTAAHAKYAESIRSNTVAGEGQLTQGFDTKAVGWSAAEVGQLLQVTLELDKPSQEEIEHRVVAPLEKLVTEIAKADYPISVAFAGKSYLPAHITYHRADFRKSPPGELKRVYSDLNADSRFVDNLDALVGADVSLDTFVNGKSPYICAAKPSDQLLGLRTEFSSLYKGVASPGSNVVIPEYNLIHSAIAAIQTMSPEAGTVFAAEAPARIDLNQPLIAKVGSVLFTPASTHIRRHRQDLLRSN